MYTPVNVKTSNKLLESSYKFSKLSTDLIKRGYIRESQNVKRAALALEKASISLDRRFVSPQMIAKIKKLNKSAVHITEHKPRVKRVTKDTVQ